MALKLIELRIFHLKLKAVNWK